MKRNVEIPDRFYNCLQAVYGRELDMNEVYKVSVQSSGKYDIERLDEDAKTSLINMGVDIDEPSKVCTYDPAILDVTTYVCKRDDVVDSLLYAALDRLEKAQDSDEISRLSKLIEDVNKYKSIHSDNVVSMFG